MAGFVVVAPGLVVVEGSPRALTVRLLDPLGTLLATGGSLVAGTSASGLDAPAGGAGLYTVEAIDLLGGAGTVEVSVARTVRVE
jgi:hypothetical protein